MGSLKGIHTVLFLFRLLLINSAMFSVFSFYKHKLCHVEHAHNLFLYVHVIDFWISEILVSLVNHKLCFKATVALN